MGLQITRSKDYSNLLTNVIENELHPVQTNNEVLWVAMGNELEIQGIEKNQISTIMRKDIEDMLYEKQFKEFMSREEYKWHNGKYWLVTKKNGWTDSKMARNVKSDPDEDQDNSSINTKNADLIDVLLDTREVINLALTKAKEFIEIEEIFGKKYAREFCKQLRMINSNCKYAFDDKTKIPQNTEQVLLNCLATGVGSLNFSAKTFLNMRVKLLENQYKKFLTVKQSSKFQNGDKASQLPLLKPDSRDTAIFAGYFGVQCKCKSWRIRRMMDGNNVECFDCDREFYAKTVSKCSYCQIPLYRENLLFIIKKGKCENCDTHIVLPKELIIYAKNS